MRPSPLGDDAAALVEKENCGEVDGSPSRGGRAPALSAASALVPQRGLRRCRTSQPPPDLSIALGLAQAAKLRMRRLTVRDRIGVPMYHSPLAVFAAEDGRDAQLVRLPWRAAHRCRRVLDSGDVAEIAADSCRKHLVLERLAVENREATHSNTGAISGQPVLICSAPNRLTGSLWDQSATRGPASPL